MSLSLLFWVTHLLFGSDFHARMGAYTVLAVAGLSGFAVLFALAVCLLYGGKRC